MIMRTILLAALSTLIFLAPASAQTLIGWRTDGTGRYPSANPPKTWGLDKNVVWKTKLPNFSVATPVIVGDKIFVCSEPTSLLCINKADGKILWEKKSTYAELPWTDEDKRGLAVEKAQAEIIQAEKKLRQVSLTRLERLLKQDAVDPKVTRKQIDELRAEINQLEVKRKSLPLLMRATEPYRDGTAGYSQCTPVSNGKQVFVMYGNCLVACYDLDGTRRWLKLMEHSTADYGHGSSPTLVGETLLVHYTDLVALDTKDGSERWRIKMRPLHGTSIPTRIDGADVVITPTGAIVRVADGKIVADKLGQCGENAPILHDNIAYFISGGARAVRLPSASAEKFESLWKANVKGGGYWFASPIYHDGLIYAVSASGPFSVLDAKTGKLVYDIRLEFEGEVYPSICLAGNLLYVSSENGTTLVLAPGREYKEIARNSLETFRSTPVFEGRRMYVRTQKHLWCIGE